MATGLYVYETDKGTKYAIRIDRALAALPMFGFEPVGDLKLDGLPRNMKPRSVGCYDSTSVKYRRFPYGKKTAPIVKLLVKFIYKGVPYAISRFTPERSRK